MIDSRTAQTAGQRARADSTLTLGLAAVVVFFAIAGFVTFYNTRTLFHNALLTTRTHEVLSTLSNVLSLIKDAETGQRGFVLTGDESYLEPFHSSVAAIEPQFTRLRDLTEGNAEHQSRVPELRDLVTRKFSELNETIELRRKEGFEAAKVLVVTDRGKSVMDSIRSQIAEMQRAEREIRTRRLSEMDDAYQVAVASGILSAILGTSLALAIAYLLRRQVINRLRQEWMQMGLVGLGNAMAGDQRAEQLGENVLRFFAQYLGAQVGAFFVLNGDHFRSAATYGVPSDHRVPEIIALGDGLVGQAAKDNKAMVVRDVPDEYLTIGSTLGHGNPKQILVIPAEIDGAVNAVFELGFSQSVDDSLLMLLREAAEPVAIAVRSANYRAHLQNLLEESQRQAEELQVQGEELRVGNEELEEQSRALRESQSRLEQQQAELEQTNSQLESQAVLLEGQRDDLARAKVALEMQAREMEQASQYKSDFLANMSHELRTPLNSTLILAKLLADNPQGNLSDEQMQFARTIESSGNDLLALINDILDLAKIEAGRMEIRPESVRLQHVQESLNRTFEPMAGQKHLQLAMKIAPMCPAVIDTDRQRLEQVLKNLLSNAIKFTEQGTVSLNIAETADGRVAFAVTDTGIGIAADQQQLIFEAFRQADGTSNRRYGGTGLGLSISRELVRLLGGDMRLVSEPGQGSTFTVTLPTKYEPSHGAQRGAMSTSAAPAQPPWTPPAPVAVPATASLPSPPLVVSDRPRMNDDRGHLSGSHRVILVVEDDAPFARILYDLVHEVRFECLIATTAEEALILCQQYRPSAVVLDVGLPDHSGLSVLDRLKHDPRTRHIPVHVVSAGDHAETALALGAVGYMLKPVKRDDLLHALRHLEARLERRLRRVLVVEDDPVQRDSMKKLLGSNDVETVGVATAAECLNRLRSEVFDCMVLDLSLPDASGFSLLETLSQEDAYSFPPAIVYTGRDLTADEEQRLRRYSKSIIIKGAKSPERLLDEVTLFLHQVVSELPAEQQKMLQKARSRDAVLEGRRILVVEDDVRNVFALTSILEPRGAKVQITRNGREAIEALSASMNDPEAAIDLVLMDVMMPEMDGLTATREIRKRSEWKKLPILMLTAKAMRDDQEHCLAAGANDYMAKPLDVEKLLSLVRVWMPK